ncbi:MAG: AgmX/PglI C-terminal domain-containing protein [bacterium]
MTPPVCLRVAVLWHDTLLAEATVDTRRPITIGADPACTLLVPDLADVGDRHVLFAPDADGAVALHLTAAMRARRATRAGTPLEAIPTTAAGTPIADGDWGLVELAPGLAIFFQTVGRPERLPPAAPWGAMDAPVLGALLGALATHLAVLVVAFLFWDISPALAVLDVADRFPSFFVEPPPPETAPEPEAEEPIAEVAKAAGGEVGAFGEPDKTEPSKVPEREGQLVDRVKDVGIHRAIGSDLLGRGPLQHVFGDKTGFDSKLSAAMAGAGDTLIIGAGAQGMGLRGTGHGGGGAGFGRVTGMGSIDTGNGGGPRATLADKQRRRPTVRVRSEAPGLGGHCKEGDITRVVGARQSGIKYCYEKALARAPELQGKVTVNWRILLDGKVGSVMIEASTLGDREVEDCISRQVRRWSFPKPEGGMCQVRYPFVFNAGL